MASAIAWKLSRDVSSRAESFSGAFIQWNSRQRQRPIKGALKVCRNRVGTSPEDQDQPRRAGESISAFRPKWPSDSGNAAPRTSAALAWPMAGEVWMP
ncbi:hypothetical protein D3C78_1532170 [compost metagenome]